MLVDPGADELVEFLELAFGVGLGRTIFEPAAEVTFDLFAGHVRDARHGCARPTA